jgi:hypothetical protein
MGLPVKARVLFAALGVALLSGCTTPKAPQVAAIVPPSAPRPTLTPAQPGPWRITKTEWSKADEAGFGEFLREIAESGCTTTIACMQSAANFYHDSDLPFLFHADCAKWAYMLRAYYASKNGLPFSYVDKISGDVAADLRYAGTPNLALERHDIVDSGTGIDAVAELQALHDKVWTATYRMDPTAETPVVQDFYSPKIQPGSIRPGTAIYDTTGHVMIVYEVTSDGSILYMDAHPDETVSRGAYGPHVPKSPASLGGGFKNFRPLKLVGATLRADGSYVGGYVVPAANAEIADYSLEQYQGNVAVAANADPNLQFRYNNASLDLYEYTRAAMSSGGFAFNPVYELQVTMSSLCHDAQDGTRDARARMKSGFATLYADMSKAADLWRERDLRVAYHGTSLRETLAETYTSQDQACAVANAGDGKPPAASPLDQFVRRSPETDVQRLISQIAEPAPFVRMQPVGQ